MQFRPGHRLLYRCNAYRPRLSFALDSSAQTVPYGDEINTEVPVALVALTA